MYGAANNQHNAYIWGRNDMSITYYGLQRRVSEDKEEIEKGKGRNWKVELEKDSQIHSVIEYVEQWGSYKGDGKATLLLYNAHRKGTISNFDRGPYRILKGCRLNDKTTAQVLPIKGLPEQ